MERTAFDAYCRVTPDKATSPSMRLLWASALSSLSCTGRSRRSACHSRSCSSRSATDMRALLGTTPCTFEAMLGMYKGYTRRYYSPLQMDEVTHLVEVV